MSRPKVVKALRLDKVHHKGALPLYGYIKVNGVNCKVEAIKQGILGYRLNLPVGVKGDNGSNLMVFGSIKLLQDWVAEFQRLSK